MIIKGGKVVASGNIAAMDILVGTNGKIVKVAPNIPDSGEKIIDASGLFALPGIIDPHVHFRDPEDTSKEDFGTGSASALSGGVTAVMDMPNYRNPPTTDIPAYEEKRKIVAAKARCDYVLRFGASETNFNRAAEAAGKHGARQLKIFLTDTNSDLFCSNGAMVKHFESFPKELPICLHCENQARIDGRKGKFKEHWEIRDAECERISVKLALDSALETGRRAHICHASTAGAVKMCRECAKSALAGGKHPITHEVTPHHLYLSTDDLEMLEGFGDVNPPVRLKGEQELLWKSIGDDTMIASDHAPHLPSQKKAGASGFPGVGTLLPLMLKAVHEKRLGSRQDGIRQVVKMCCENPADAFGLSQKGRIEAGKDADIVLVDMEKKWKISADNRLSKCGWTPYEGWEVIGGIEKVFLRGKLAYDGENVVAKKGEGKELR